MLFCISMDTSISYEHKGPERLHRANNTVSPTLPLEHCLGPALIPQHTSKGAFVKRSQLVPGPGRPVVLDKAPRLEKMMKFFKENPERQAETLTLFSFILLVTACFAETHLRPWASRCCAPGERNNPACLQICSTYSAGTRECSSIPLKQKKRGKTSQRRSPSCPVNAGAGTNCHWTASTELRLTATFQTNS